MDSLKKVLLINCFVATVVISVVAVFSYFKEIRSLNQSVDNKLSEIESLIYSQLSSRAVNAKAKADMIANQPWVQEALANNNRAKLAQMLVPMFKELQINYGATQSQFHLPPATSFLRLHKPEKFGDDLSGFRKTVLATNAYKKSHAGAEVGRAGLGIRGVVPVFNQNEHVGSFEIGFDLEPLIHNVSRLTNADISILLFNKKIQSIKKFGSMSSNGHRSVGDFSEYTSTHWDNIKPYLSASILNQVKDVKTSYDVSNPKGKATLMMPLLDFSNNMIGVVVAVSDISDMQRQSQRALFAVIAVSLLAALVVIACILVTFNGLFIGPLKELEKAIEDIEENGYIDPVNTDFQLHALKRFAEKIDHCLRTITKKDGDK